MKLDLEKHLTDLNGDPIELSGTAAAIMDELNKEQPTANAVNAILALTKAERTPVTLQTEGVRVLLATTAEQDPLDKFTKARLAEKLMQGNSADIDMQEAIMIRDAIGKFSASLIVLRCWAIIDNPIPATHRRPNDYVIQDDPDEPLPGSAGI